MEADPEYLCIGKVQVSKINKCREILLQSMERWLFSLLQGGKTK